ncbi:MAG: hypothetical protein JWM13_321 [Arthrobacter sp.]|nr:hypothetical protein [Arthrobacter sp.]
MSPGLVRGNGHVPRELGPLGIVPICPLCGPGSGHVPKHLARRMDMSRWSGPQEWICRAAGTALLGGRPLSLPFGRRPLFLCGEASTVRAPGGFGRPAGRSFGRKALCRDVGELGQGDLAISQLRALLGGGHSDDPGDKTSSETPDEHLPLVL